MNTTTIATKETSSTRRIEQTDNGMVIIEESGNEVQEQDWVDRNGMGSFEPFDSLTKGTIKLPSNVSLIQHDWKSGNVPPQIMQFGAPIVSGLWDQTHSFVSNRI